MRSWARNVDTQWYHLKDSGLHTLETVINRHQQSCKGAIQLNSGHRAAGSNLRHTAGAALLQGCSRPPMQTHRCGDAMMATAFAANTDCNHPRHH